MAKVCKHQAIKDRPHKGDYLCRVSLAIPWQALCLSDHFKVLRITFVIEKCGHRGFAGILKVDSYASILNHGNIVIASKFLELAFHVRWDITRYYRKILRPAWLSSCFKHILCYTGSFT